MVPPPTLLRARILVPIAAPPLDDGAVLIDGNRIAAVGPYSELRSHFPASLVDLGDAVLLPGLVNAHCHFDYTDMTGLPAPKHFCDWIKALLALKATASYTDYAAAWLRGAQMLLRSGATTVADIEAVPELLPDVWSSTPLRVVSLIELTGVKSRRDPADIVRDAAAKIDSMPHARSCAGLSPHALYSTSPALLQQSASVASERGWRVAMHVAESNEESEMYATRSGALFEWLQGQRDMSDCGGRTPVGQAARCGLLRDNFLAVHANYLTDADIDLLARSGASVAHCPRSHAYFGHAAFPCGGLVKRNINVCLGTDSLASVARVNGAPLELSMFAELRQFALANPAALPQAILGMATINGARALGRDGQIGALSPGALADLIVLPISTNRRDVLEAIVHDAAHVSAVMIDGRWAIAPEND